MTELIQNMLHNYQGYWISLYPILQSICYLFHYLLLRFLWIREVGYDTVFAAADGGKVVFDTSPHRNANPIETDEEGSNQTIMAQIDHRTT